MDLNSAINDLKATIAADGFSCGLVREIAEDYDLNPILLERKFTESTGRAPRDWTPPQPVPERNLESLRPLAEKWYNEQFRGPGMEIGQAFKRGDRRGFVVATNQVFYIDAQNETRRVITFRNSAHRASWVDAQLEA